jgi:hypothetical protein
MVRNKDIGPPQKRKKERINPIKNEKKQSLSSSEACGVLRTLHMYVHGSLHLHTTMYVPTHELHNPTIASFPTTTPMM